MARTAEYGLGEFTFPRGWFMIARSADLGNVPMALRMFGRDLALYRGESGAPHLLDAYCPHMKAHLAAEQTSTEGAHRIEGESIRCPYHWWRFGPDGRCNHVPYFDGAIPPAAKIRAYPTQERFGCIFAWHDPEEQAPDFDLPEIGEWDDPAWMRCDWDDLGTLAVHPQEITDNLVDARHFGPIHGQRIAYFESVFDGVIGRQYSGGGHETMVATDEGVMDVDAFYQGPGLLVARYAGDTDAVQLVFHTPKEDGVTQVWHGLLTRAHASPPSVEDIAINQQYHDVGLAAFSQDFAIWQSKAPAVQIMRMPGDGPFHRCRAWYRQFYNPRARASEFQARADGAHDTQGISMRAPLAAE
ncbi:Rieske 2Fe-2S domain-containing protein [Caenibius sp. WL]|uniref:Rieske 2Fe-2S domain-containing protein n=1 Tax=Caenibius sp. WL TaxID=2872646 RepID=UPI001C992ECF|nr:Rieske 2Fe-2S domain-containing protein [Caenibius sp. WL]QZP09236.1 Rieske (2Fe-2S) protein [Caenibius sp. WL]